METERDLRKLSDCTHCRNSPTATKPFLKMKKIPLKDMEYMEKLAAADGKSVDCFVCEVTETLLEGLREK